ncbi:hypothetical protein J6590_068063 [Homalodisca vitripennis]|nr:hypothetical protein J6590_068063 [Homalodisca vitripennis]
MIGGPRPGPSKNIRENLFDYDLPEIYPKQICFIGENLEEELEYLKVFNLPVLEVELNNNKFHPESCTIYVLDDFEDNPLLDSLNSVPHTWVLGTTALEEMCMDAELEIRSQPTFCTSMYGLCFYINCPGKVPLMIYNTEASLHLIRLSSSPPAPEECVPEPLQVAKFGAHCPCDAYAS